MADTKNSFFEILEVHFKSGLITTRGLNIDSERGRTPSVEVAAQQRASIYYDPIGVEIFSRAPKEETAFIRFNERLSASSWKPLNESDLVRIMDELGTLPDLDRTAYFLTLARITELALVCAGNYADGCEFEAVGDLLVNPRIVDIYVRGKKNPVQKNRHGGISSQLAGLMGDGDPIDWLKHNTLPHIRKQALLPALYEELIRSGILTSDYLASVMQRMRQISSTVTFLFAWQIDNAIELQRRLDSSSSSTRSFLTNNLCRFDLTVFHEIGKDIAGFSKGKNACRFLCKEVFK